MSAIAMLAVLLTGADVDRARTVLHPQTPNVEGLVRIIENREFTAADRRQAENALHRLSSDSFLQRESATRALIDLGAKAKPLVSEAAEKAQRDRDLERYARLRYVHSEFQKTNDTQRVWAAAVLLQNANPTPNLAISERLLDVLPSLPTRYLRAPVTEAAWHHLRRDHPDESRWCRTMLTEGTTAQQQAAALVMLGTLTKKPELAARYQNDPSPDLRLAAARLMSLTAPKTAAMSLASLHRLDRRDIRGESLYLLRELHRVSSQADMKQRMSAEAWQDWAETSNVRPLVTPQPFRWGVLRTGIREDFHREQLSLANGYGPFVYQTTTPANASVVEGLLLLDGNHAEGDQRLAILAEQLISEPFIRDAFTVDAGIGGKAGNEVGWHVGLSIGRVKFLFHPGYTGGAFRVEDVTTHDYLLPNQTMPFTPRSNVMHKMRVHCEPSAEGGAKFRVQVTDGGTGKSYSTDITLAAHQTGPLNRIGLERSGRTGGAAMFDHIEVSLFD